MAQHLNKIKSGDNDLDPRDFDLPVDMNISLPPSSCIPHRTMVKMMYVDTSRYCPLYDKRFRGLSAKQIKKEVKKICKYGLDNKSWFPAVDIEQKGNDIEPCISVEQNSKINRGSSDSTMEQANSSNKMVKMAYCNPGLTQEMERSVNKDVKVIKNNTKGTLFMYLDSCQTKMDRRDNQEMKTKATSTDAKNGKILSADYLKTKTIVTNTGGEYSKMSADGDAQRRNKNAFKVESAKRNEHVHGDHNVFDCTEPCVMEKKQDSKMAELHNKDLTVQSSKVLKTKKENKYQDRYLVESSKSNVQQQNRSARSESGKQKDMCMNKGHKHIDEQNQTKTPSSSVCLPKFSKNIDKKLQTLSEEKCKKKNKDGGLVPSPKMDASVDKTNFDLMVKKLDKLEYAIFNLMETIDEDSGLESEAYRN